MTAVTAEVPGYTGALGGEMGENIGAAVQMALAGFLKLAAGARDADPSTPLGPTLEGAYDLGRGEARNGRSIDALLAAYRVGARVAWRDMAALAAQAGVEASTMAQFAELVFAYIDELSAASVAGHTDELSTSGRVRERYRERLSQHLLAGAGDDVLADAAERAGWTPPTTLTAVLVPSAQVRGVLASLERGDPRRRRGPAGRRGRRRASALAAPGPRCGRGRAGGTCSGCSPDGRPCSVRPGRGRGPARRTTGRPAPRRWSRARTGRSTARTTSPSSSSARTRMRSPTCGPGCSRRWTTCGRPAVSDSRRRLRSWLLHQGRRDAVAAELHVHAQTVRYRMGQLRELYGDRLDDPATVLDLLLALSGGAQAAQVRPDETSTGWTWQSRHHVVGQQPPRHGRPPSS